MAVFDNLTDLVQGIQQTIRELQSNIQFNSKTGTYDMSKLNFTTVTRMQNALGKALKITKQHSILTNIKNVPWSNVGVNEKWYSRRRSNERVQCRRA